MIVILPKQEADRRLLFSYNLLYLMQDNEMSRTRLAKKMGISRSVIDKFIQCTDYPSDEMIQCIASALGCKPSELTDDSSIPWNMGRGLNED